MVEKELRVGNYDLEVRAVLEVYNSDTWLSMSGEVMR